MVPVRSKAGVKLPNKFRHFLLAVRHLSVYSGPNRGLTECFKLSGNLTRKSMRHAAQPWGSPPKKPAVLCQVVYALGNLKDPASTGSRRRRKGTHASFARDTC